MAETAGTCVVVAAGPDSAAAVDIANAFKAADADVVLAVSADGELPPELEPQGMSGGMESTAVHFAEPNEVQALVIEVASTFSGIDVWVNDFSASATNMPVDAVDAQQWNQTIESTLSATFWCCQAAGGAMLERGGGVIVNVVSPDAYVASAGSVATSAAMAGISMLTKALAVEWASSGVRVVGVAGLGPTAKGPEHRIPLKRHGSGQELAEAVLFLAGPDADYVTGEVLPVDGGWASYQLF